MLAFPAVGPGVNAAGRPMSPGIRARMESQLGHDFRSVRIHTDSRAAASADAERANAYTVGENVVFGARRYDPSSAEGVRLLGHELAHVVQQRRGGVTPGRGGDHDNEASADLVGQAVAAGHSVPSVPGASGIGLARDPRHDRGYAGEQGAGFEHYSSKDGWIILEGPSGGAGHQATARGFDAVAYNAKTGELHLVDNKSLKREGSVYSATAIDRNLRTNVEGLRNRIKSNAYPLPPGVRTKVLGLLDGTLAAIDKATPIPAKVHRVVTGVGGRSTDVSPGLTQKGIEFRPSTAPGKVESGSPPPPTAKPAAKVIVSKPAPKPSAPAAVTKAPAPKAPAAPPPKPVAPPESVVPPKPAPAEPVVVPKPSIAEPALPTPKAPAVAEPAAPGAAPKAGGWSGVGSGLLSVGLPLVLGLIHGPAVRKRIEEQAKTEGYVPHGGGSGQGFLYDLGAWLLDPFGDAEAGVGTADRLDFPVWRGKIRTATSALKTGGIFKMTWEDPTCDRDIFGHTVIKEYEVEYTKQADGTWEMTKGSAPGAPDLNDIVGTKLSDDQLKAMMTAVDPCSTTA